MKKLLKLIGKYKIFLAFSVIFATISVVLQLYVPVSHPVVQQIHEPRSKC